MKNNIAKIRKQRGLKQIELAESLGMKVATLGTWERGVYEFTLEDAWHIADILHCTLDDLAGRKPPEPRQADLRKARMIEDYDELSESGKDAAAAAVGGIRDGELSRIMAEGDEANENARQIG